MRQDIQRSLDTIHCRCPCFSSSVYKQDYLFNATHQLVIWKIETTLAITPDRFSSSMWLCIKYNSKSLRGLIQDLKT